MSTYLKQLCDLSQSAGGCVTLNLGDSTAYSCLIEKYGGQSFLSDQAAQLGQVLSDTRHTHETQGTNYRTLLSSPKGEPDGLQDAVYISYAYYDAAAKKVKLRCVTSFTQIAAVCNIQIDILDEDHRQIAKHYIVKNNIQFAAEPENGEINIDTQSGITDSVFTVMLTVAVMFPNRPDIINIVSAIQFSTDKLLASSDITHPIKHFRHSAPIHVLYGRRPNREDPAIDYIYEDALHGSKTEMMLDIAGTAAFKDRDQALVKERLDECTAIMDMKKGAFLYKKNGGLRFSGLKGDAFGWTFDNDWGGEINRAAFNASNLSYLSVMLRYEAKTTSSRPQSMMLSSFLDDDLDSDCRAISPLDLKIGCLASGTMIKMADSQQKPIRQIQVGDRVWCQPEGRPATVWDIFTGREETMIVIETDGGPTVTVTPTHLVQTSEGLVEAQNINAGMSVMTEDGLRSIRFLYSINYQEQVYDLYLLDADNDALILADGVCVGVMNTAVPTSPPPLAESTVTSELCLEFEKVNGP